MVCSVFAANPVAADVTARPPSCSSLPVSPVAAFAATVMPGETILHDERLYGTRAFPTGTGVDVLPGTYDVIVHYTSTSGTHDKTHHITVP